MDDAVSPPRALPLVDTAARPLRKLRVSVTDRCNLRCRYCMPAAGYAWQPREQTLRFEEITRIVAAMAGLGVERIRLTGGEPLLRRELPRLVDALVGVRGIRSVALTTNGLLLAREAAALHGAGLVGVTVSLDTLDPGRFSALAGSDRHRDVLAGIDAALAAGFARIKLNTVVMRGVNDDELESIVEFAHARGLEPRFVEYMDVGGARTWSMSQVVSQAEMLERLARRFGAARPVGRRDGAPAERFRFGDGPSVGIIASVTRPFCSACDRARLLANGLLLTCLYATQGTDLRALVRASDDPTALRDTLVRLWGRRTDRGAEERLRRPDRGPSFDEAALSESPHLEMHSRGG